MGVAKRYPHGVPWQVQVPSSEQGAATMWALVKFKDDPTPILYGISNSGYAEPLTSMEGVEWVSQVITSSGYVVGKSKFQRNQALGEISVAPFKPSTDQAGSTTIPVGALGA